MKKLLIALMLVTIALAGCQPENTKSAGGSEVKLITLKWGKPRRTCLRSRSGRCKRSSQLDRTI
ncbi:MAG: hypothetical protein ACYSO3_06410 [Planctomycetota bacterium]